jgi:hypothetical protein
MSTEANTAQLQRLADEVLTGHNLAALDEIFHADYVENEPPPGMGPGRDRPVHRRQNRRKPDHYGHSRDDAATWCYPFTGSTADLTKLRLGGLWNAASNVAAMDLLFPIEPQESRWRLPAAGHHVASV